MSVVLRCQNCGTKQRHLGECEACAEGEVQYFCTNHEEGIWLSDPVCGRCGAKFGDPPRRPAPASPPPAPARPSGAPDFRPPAGRAPDRARTPDPGLRRPRRRDLDDRADPEVVPSEPSLVDLLEEITEAGRRRRAPYEVDETPWPVPPRRGAGFPLAGCLVRLLGLGLLLLIAFVIFMFVLFGGIIGG